jgi:hypothetical protein
MENFAHTRRIDTTILVPECDRRAGLTLRVVLERASGRPIASLMPTSEFI